MTSAPVPLLAAVTGRWEAPLVTGLERSASGVQVVRRCADLAELLAAAAAGLARAAVVSADLPRLDGEALARLRACGVAVVVLAEADDPRAAHQLRRLGVPAPLPADTPSSVVARAVLAAVEGDVRGAGTDGLFGPGSASGVAGAPGFPGACDGASGVTPSAGLRGTGSPSPPSGASAQVWDPPGPAIGGFPAAGGLSAAGGVDLTAGGVDPAADGSRPGQLVAVWGPTGAPGRTTVAVTLATEFALAGLPTLIADADTYGPSVAQTLALLDESAGLAAATRAANQGALDLQRLARLAPVVQPGLRVLTGIPRPGRWPELRPSGLQLVWQVARALAAWTVVDCGFGLESDEEVSFDVAGPRRNGATLCTLAEADVVLVIGSADPIGLHRLMRGLQDLREVLPPGQYRRVVVTRVRESAVGSRPQRKVADALARYAGVSDAVLVPDDRPACDAAMLAGRSLSEVAPQSPARQALAQLATQLITAVAGLTRLR
jgi:MinD-like ATPase involved in chromosome partitioning or flagellar assembly